MRRIQPLDPVHLPESPAAGFARRVFLSISLPSSPLSLFHPSGVSLHGRRFRYQAEALRGMRLIAVTPGVPMARIRERLGGPIDGLAVCVRASPCGRLPIEPHAATRLTVVVTRCAVSIHAADRVLEAAGHARRSPRGRRRPSTRWRRKQPSRRRQPPSPHRHRQQPSTRRRQHPSDRRQHSAAVVLADAPAVPAWLRARFPVPVRCLDSSPSVAGWSKR